MFGIYLWGIYKVYDYSKDIYTIRKIICIKVAKFHYRLWDGRRYRPGRTNATAAAMRPPIVPPAWAMLTSCRLTRLGNRRRRPADTTMEKTMGQGMAPSFIEI